MDNVYNSLVNAASRWPDNVVVFDAYGQLTYSELLAHTNTLKTHLLTSGLQPGMGLGIIAGNSRYFIIALYAGVGCGSVVMPVSPLQKEKEIAGSIAEANLHMVIADAPEFATFGENISTTDFFPQPLYISKTKRDPKHLTASFVQDAAFMRFTSGTTGKAKGVIISNKAAMQRVEAANEALHLSEKDRVVWVLPMAYHFIVSIVLYLKVGAGIIINDSFLAESIIESINEKKGTFLYAAPMHIKLLAGFTPKVQLPSLSKVISTTTAISAAVCKAFETKYKIPVSQAYGIIEIGLPIINLQKSKTSPEAVGYALPAYDVAILDQHLNPLPDETIGLLGIKGPGMFDGYLSPPTLKEDVLKNGWFMTGDYAVRNKDSLIIIRGREKSMINVVGNKVFPGDVEDVVNTYAGIKESRAYAKVHPLMGEVVGLEIVIEPETQIDTEALISYCRQSLSSFKVPQFVSVVDKIEITGSGKIKRA